MKCNQPRPGFELVSPCPFPTTITITQQAPPNTYFWIYIYIYVCVCVCVCMCVCVWERERERERKRERGAWAVIINERKIYVGVVLMVCLLHVVFLFIFIPSRFDFKIFECKTFYLNVRNETIITDNFSVWCHHVGKKNVSDDNEITQGNMFEIDYVMSRKCCIILFLAETIWGKIDPNIYSNWKYWEK